MSTFCNILRRRPGGYRFAAVLTAALAVAGLAAGELLADDPAPEDGAVPQESSPKKPAENEPDTPQATVVVRNCRVKILDQRTLASDRPGVLEFVGFRDDTIADGDAEGVKDLEEGDLVSAGQVVVGLKDDVAKAGLAVAAKKAENDVNVRYAAKEWAVNQLEHEKAMKVNEDVPDAISEIELEKLKLAAERGGLSVEQAEFQQDVAKLEAEQADAEWRTHRVTCPVDGVVTRIHRRPGEAVRQGDPILDVVDTSRLRVEGYVELEDSFRVRRGQPVTVRLELPNRDLPYAREVFEGTVRAVDVEVQKIDGTVRFWAEVRNENGWLRSGLSATATIAVDDAPPQTVDADGDGDANKLATAD